VLTEVDSVLPADPAAPSQRLMLIVTARADLSAIADSGVVADAGQQEGELEWVASAGLRRYQTIEIQTGSDIITVTGSNPVTSTWSRRIHRTRRRAH
jgi:hypothetical protein